MLTNGYVVCPAVEYATVFVTLLAGTSRLFGVNIIIVNTPDKLAGNPSIASPVML